MSTPIPPQEGIGNYVLDLSRRLIERGHSVIIVTRGGWKWVGTEVFNGIQVLRPPFAPLYPFHIHVHGLYVNKLVSSLESKLDILHIHSPLCPPLRSSLPTVVTMHSTCLRNRAAELVDPMSLALKFQNYPSFLLEKELLKKSTVTTTVSKAVMSQLSMYGVSVGRPEIVGNGVDHDFFKPAEKKDPRRYILFVGRLSYRKGLFNLVGSARKVCSIFPDVTFVIVGEGPLKRDLVKRAASLGLRQRFQFLGYVPRERLSKLYQNSDVCVVPSYYEGLPTTLLEAMACERPVVATYISGIWEVIRNGENGLLVSSGSLNELSDAIIKVLEDKDLANRLGIEARRTIVSQYTREMVTDRVEAVYKKIVER